MTDEQIVQGMEEIAAFKSLNLGCRRVLWFAINLINRQKAEIERLKKDKYILKDGNLELLPRTDIDIIKSEAIREFAEMFNSLLSDFADYDTLHIYEIKDRIDILKEMVGDE